MKKLKERKREETDLHEIDDRKRQPLRVGDTAIVTLHLSLLSPFLVLSQLKFILTD
jgi:hypothetical protein